MLAASLRPAGNLTRRFMDQHQQRERDRVGNESQREQRVNEPNRSINPNKQTERGGDEEDQDSNSRPGSTQTGRDQK